MKRLLLSLFLLLSFACAEAQEYDYKFRLYLKDKGESEFSIDRPEEFLSERAIQRRKSFSILIDKTDLPISVSYLTAIEKTGARIVAKSKWLNTVSINCQDSMLVEVLKKLPFVDSTTLVWKGEQLKEIALPLDTMKTLLPDSLPTMNDYYGLAASSIHLVNGDTLHTAGFRGKGIEIAIIDAGYRNLPHIELLNNINIKGYKGFVDGRSNLVSGANNQHGLNVLSCIATNQPNLFVGTAPEASFWLLGSEDPRSEFPIEQDYWAAAIEFADSVGVDVTNTSLGYSRFDYPTQNLNHSDLNGRNTLISRAANMATKKGMLLVTSAGNSATTPWHKITPPADAENVLTIGAVQQDSLIAPFSSRGFTHDLRVKPDVMALGVGAAVVNDMGKISFKSGTSFSSPIMCGLMACLRQAFPSLTNSELILLVQKSADKYDHPDENYGYGIPDMKKVMLAAADFTEQKGINKIALTERFRIESDGIGLLRVVIRRENDVKRWKIRITKRKNGKIVPVLSDTFATEKYSKDLKGTEKEIYHLHFIGANNEQEDIQIYF